MDTRKTIKKIELSDTRLDSVKRFVNELTGLNQKQRFEYLKTISNRDIALIREILINVINGNINVGYDRYILLKRVKKYIYKLVSKTTSIKLKKKILASIKGLQILSLVLPLVIEFLS